MTARAGIVLAAGAAIMPPLAVMAPLGLAPLLGAMALALLALERRAALDGIAGLAPLAALLGALALWAMASSAWSILPLHSFLEGVRFLVIAGFGLVVVAAALRHPYATAWPLTAGIVAAIVLLMIERSTGAGLTRLLADEASAQLPLTRFDRGATTLALAMWPASAGMALRGHRIAALALAAAAAAAVLLLDSSTAKLAVAAGAIAFVAARWTPRAVALALAVGLIAGAFALPFAAPDGAAATALHQEAPWLKFTAIHRLLIWRFTADRIAERPILGWGMDASRALPGGKTNLAALYPKAGLQARADALPLHPHDAALQWRVELGLPGLLLCLAIVCWCLWRARSAAALAASAAALVIGMLSYGAWQAWWVSCLFLVAAMLAATPPAAESGRATADNPARDRP